MAGDQVSIGEASEIVHFNGDKGYGFISTNHPAVDQDVFVHISDVKYDRLFAFQFSSDQS